MFKFDDFRPKRPIKHKLKSSSRKEKRGKRKKDDVKDDVKDEKEGDVKEEQKKDEGKDEKPKEGDEKEKRKKEDGKGKKPKEGDKKRKRKKEDVKGDTKDAMKKPKGDDENGKPKEEGKKGEHWVEIIVKSPPEGELSNIITPKSKGIVSKTRSLMTGWKSLFGKGINVKLSTDDLPDDDSEFKKFPTRAGYLHTGIAVESDHDHTIQARFLTGAVLPKYIIDPTCTRNRKIQTMEPASPSKKVTVFPLKAEPEIAQTTEEKVDVTTAQDDEKKEKEPEKKEIEKPQSASTGIPLNVYRIDRGAPTNLGRLRGVSIPQRQPKTVAPSYKIGAEKVDALEMIRRWHGGRVQTIYKREKKSYGVDEFIFVKPESSKLESIKPERIKPEYIKPESIKPMSAEPLESMPQLEIPEARKKAKPFFKIPSLASIISSKTILSKLMEKIRRPSLPKSIGAITPEPIKLDSVKSKKKKTQKPKRKKIQPRLSVPDIEKILAEIQGPQTPESPKKKVEKPEKVYTKKQVSYVGPPKPKKQRPKSEPISKPRRKKVTSRPASLPPYPIKSAQSFIDVVAEPKSRVRKVEKVASVESTPSEEVSSVESTPSEEVTFSPKQESLKSLHRTSLVESSPIKVILSPSHTIMPTYSQLEMPQRATLIEPSPTQIVLSPVKTMKPIYSQLEMPQRATIVETSPSEIVRPEPTYDQVEEEAVYSSSPDVSSEPKIEKEQKKKEIVPIKPVVPTVGTHICAPHICNHHHHHHHHHPCMMHHVPCAIPYAYSFKYCSGIPCAYHRHQCASTCYHHNADTSRCLYHPGPHSCTHRYMGTSPQLENRLHQDKLSRH